MIEEMKTEVIVLKIRDVMGSGTSSFEIRGNLIKHLGEEKGARAYESLMAGRWE